jgi:hypothetical protein
MKVLIDGRPSGAAALGSARAPLGLAPSGLVDFGLRAPLACDLSTSSTPGGSRRPA